MITLIDADSIIYIVGWNFKDKDPEMPGVIDELGQALDGFVHGVLQVTQATKFAGFFSCPTADCFRTKVATFKPYKGTRPDKPEWIRTWEPHIKNWLIGMWGFKQAVNIEADDCVASGAHFFIKNKFDVCIASNDKDLKQVPCSHYSYKTRRIEDISVEQAWKLLWLQVLTGDTSDNIAGVPGLGPKKAEKVLLGHAPEEYPQLVENEFVKHFGDEEGLRIFAETKCLVRMLDSRHVYTQLYCFDVQDYDLEGVMETLQNNPVYNQYNNSNNDIGFADFL